MLEGITVLQGQYLVLSQPNSQYDSSFPWSGFCLHRQPLPLTTLLTLHALRSLDFFSSLNAIGLLSPLDFHKYCSFRLEHRTQPPLTTPSPANSEFSFRFHLNTTLKYTSLTWEEADTLL